MKPLTLRHLLSLAGLSLASGFFACREPTQITLDVTTDALCPQAELSSPRLVDAMFATGKQLDPGNFAAAALTDQCQTGDPNSVGTLVLLPSGSDDLTVEVLVVAGVELAGPSSEIAPLRLSAEGCQELVRAGGVGAIQGKPCILVRRRLGFVEHTKLSLPIDLDTRCIGKKCGEDESCFKGNCVSLDVDCDASGCVEPQTCIDKCDEYCASGNSECVNNACNCLACDDTTCAATCGLTQTVGSCQDDVCLCKAACDQAACSSECDGECTASTCGCQSCDAEACGAGGPNCSCAGDPESCVCVGACEPVSCGAQDCGALGFLGACGESMGEPACICACDDSECDSDCEFGGACQENGLCGCNSQCIDAECTQNCSIEWKSKRCYQGGCACVCEETLCEEACEGVPGSRGSHCTLPGDPAGVCDCEIGSPTGGNGSGAGGTGGDGGNGGIGTGSSGGFGNGGNGGSGGTETTTSGCSCAAVVCAGFGEVCDPGQSCTCQCQATACNSFCMGMEGVSGSCVGSPGTCMCDSSTTTTVGGGCMPSVTSLGAQCSGMCSTICLPQGCDWNCAGGDCQCFP